MEQQEKVRLTARYGMLIALAFIFSYIEAMIPIPSPVPVKLGLANLVSVVGLYTIGIPGTIVISLTRIILAGFTFGNMSSVLYGLAGGGLSLAVMIGMKQTGWFGKPGISVMGGVAHNIGQLLVFAFVLRSASVFAYLPFLLTAGVVAGAAIGLLGGMIVSRIDTCIKD
ncbi:MAG: Gx transporter family protein [Lachnospiraceae bacterium]